MTLFISIQLHFGCYNLKNLIIELQTYRKLRKVSRVLELIVYQRQKILGVIFSFTLLYFVPTFLNVKLKNY